MQMVNKREKKWLYSYIRQNRVSVKNCHKRQGRSLYDVKWIESKTGYNI